ncbi:two-component regulator propeller domain-containing protein [bacterium]
MNRSRVKLIVAVFALSAIAACAWLIWNRSLRPVDEYISGELEKIQKRDKLEFHEKQEGPIKEKKYPAHQYTNIGDALAITFFDGKYYIGTTGGLLEYNKDLSPAALYTILNGLSENHVTALKTFKGSLYVGLKSGGLMKLDNGLLTSYTFADPLAMNVTALHIIGDHLYIGTFGTGVVVFDGNKFSLRINHMPGARFTNVTSLSDIGDHLTVGTHENGLFVEGVHGFDSFNEDGGFISNHVVSVRNVGDELYACTPLGVVKINGRLEFEPAGQPETVTDIAHHSDIFYYGTYDRGVSASAGRTSHPLPGGMKVNRLWPDTTADRLWALTDNGARFLAGGRWNRLGIPLPQKQLLPGNYITSLAVDGLGRLWAGTFENGIAVIDGTGNVVNTIKDNACREINHISIDPADGTVWAATNQGLFVFDVNFDRKRLTESNGLISNAVTHVLHESGRKVISTAAGITIIENSQLKSFYTFHGLINNHVYTSESWNGKTFIGTLGGISVLEGDAITSSITTSNSDLGHNWITSLKVAGGRIFIGTYGAGVLAMEPGGKISFPGGVTSDFEVNFNTLHFVPPFLFAGTLDRKLLVFDTSEEKWFTANLNFGSSNVTALASEANRIYVGSDSGLIVIESEELKKSFIPVSWK